MTVQPNGFRWTKFENGLCGFLSPSRPAAPVEHPHRTPRYPLDAPAELLVEHSDAKMLVRVKELSLYGCYLDTSVPLSTKTPVQIKIFGPQDYFEASATVIYAQPNVGMGLAAVSGLALRPGPFRLLPFRTAH